MDTAASLRLPPCTLIDGALIDGAFRPASER